MYDLEVSHAGHNFTLPNGVITSNSHAVCYAYIGYVCAWLKRNYPVEWWCAVLRNADRRETDEVFFEHCGHLLLPPDIKLSGDDFAIEDDKIRCPLRMLNGIGEQAHRELVELRPFSDVSDFCQKVYNRRHRLGGEVDRAVKKKGATVGTKKVFKLGRSALNKTILAKLIVSGVADSLFPADCTDVYSKLALFNEVKARIDGARRVEAVDPRFAYLSPLQKYLLRKDVLPTHAEDLAPLAIGVLPKERYAPNNETFKWKAPRAFDGNEWVPIVRSGDMVNQILTDPDCPEIEPQFRFGVVAYVVATNRFYNNKAVKILYEVNGRRFESVLWQTKKQKDEDKIAELPEGLDHSIAILTLTRWDTGKPFSVQDIKIVAPAFALKAKGDEE